MKRKICDFFKFLNHNTLNVHCFIFKVLRDTGMHHLKLLHLLGRLALFLFMPVWLIFDLLDVIKHPVIVST